MTFDPTQFGATPVSGTQTDSGSGTFDPTKFGATYVPTTTDQTEQGTSGIFGTTNNDAGLFTSPKTFAQNIGNNLVKNTGEEISNAFNIQNTSEEDYANQEAQTVNPLGKFVGSTIVPSDYSSGVGSDVAHQAIKGAVNTVTGAVSTAYNIGSFLYNANVHPIKTLQTIASDPVGFVAALVPDSLKEVLQGVTSAGKDAWNGNWSAAAGDVGTGVQRAWTSFLDNPVQEVLKYSLVGDLLEAPAIIGGEMGAEDAATAGKSIKNIPGNTANMVKSIYKPYSKAFDIAKQAKTEGVTAAAKGVIGDVSQTLTKIFNTVKTSGQMFTQGGRSTILAGQSLTAFKAVKANMDIQDYESQLQSMDKNTPEAQALQVKLDQANIDKETATKNFSGLQYTTANYLNKILGQKYTDPESINSDLKTNLSGASIQKDASYKNSFNKPDGTPINIKDVSDFTDSLRNRADVIGQKTGNGPIAEATRAFANGMDLRQNISSAGDVPQYIDSEVTSKFNEDPNNSKLSPNAQLVLKAQLKDQITKDVYSQMKQSNLDMKSFNKPITAEDLQGNFNTFLNKKIGTDTSSLSHHFFSDDASGKSADSGYQSVMKENLNRDNPDGYKDFQNGNQQYKNLLSLDVFKNTDGTPKTFMNVDDFLSYAVKNWDSVQKLDPQLQIKIEQSLASKVLNDAIDPKTQTVNLGKLQDSFNYYKSYMKDIPQIRQILNENTLDLSKLATENPELKAQIYSMYGKTPEEVTNANSTVPVKEGEITQTEQQLKQAQGAQKIVGTDPQEIIANIKSIKSVADYNKFIENSSIKDPVQIGKLLKQDAFERNNPDPQNLTIEGMQKTFDDLNSNFNGASAKIRGKFFPKEEQVKIDTAQKTFDDLAELQKTIPKTSTALGRILQGVATGITFALGWHFQTIRFGAHLLKTPSTGETSAPLTESDFQKVLDDKNTPSVAKTTIQRIKDNYLLLSTGYASVKNKK